MLTVKKARFCRRAFQPALTKVVRTAFDQFNPKLQTCGPLQEGQVFADQLLLQIDCVGRDDQSLPVGKGPEDGWNQVGEALAGAGASLNQGDAVAIESFGDRKGHAQLFGAVFKPGQVLTNFPFCSQECRDLFVFNRCVLAGLNASTTR